MIPNEQDTAPISPRPEQNQIDAIGQVTGQTAARRLLEAHRNGLNARRQHDLLSEKYFLHIDGANDAQWADILHGQRIVIPRQISEFRKTENLLRPLVDNAVAHHTTMPLQYFADSLPDRRAREQAKIDTIWINHLAQSQDFNGLFAEALYMAMATGFCPVHAYWRDDRVDGYEPVPDLDEMDEMGEEMGMELTPGMIDCWVGNPFDTVFDRGAKRGSVHWMSYGRIVPAQQLRDQYGHVAGVNALQGTLRMPSASIYQRIARDWRQAETGMHGSSVLDTRSTGDTGSQEEQMQIVCREVLPGVDPNWPQGRIQVIAVPGNIDLRRGASPGHAIMIVDQPLPAGDFSWTNVYSHHRHDDVLGKPWVEDLDQLQVDLNIALSKRWEAVNRQMEAPIVAPGGALQDDMLDIGGYNIMEVDPSLAGWRPRVMEWPQGIIPALDKEIEDRRKALYTIGGYQAASRGESPGSRTPYKAIVALQQADNTIHGPINQRFRRSACDFARRCHSQFRAYADVPWLMEIVGDEFGYMAEPYVDRTKVSATPPNYKLVSGFGSDPEQRAAEILEMMQVRGADGGIFLSTEEARRQYPNQTMFNTQGDPDMVKRRRAKHVAQEIHNLTKEFREVTQFDEDGIDSPGVQQAAQQVFDAVERRFPRMRDDNLEAHLSTLSEIVQDETVDPIARLVAVQRQALYYEWQAQMAGGQVKGQYEAAQMQQGVAAAAGAAA